MKKLKLLLCVSMLALSAMPTLSFGSPPKSGKNGKSSLAASAEVSDTDQLVGARSFNALGNLVPGDREVPSGSVVAPPSVPDLGSAPSAVADGSQWANQDANDQAASDVSDRAASILADDARVAVADGSDGVPGAPSVDAVDPAAAIRRHYSPVLPILPGRVVSGFGAAGASGTSNRRAPVSGGNASNAGAVADPGVGAAAAAPDSSGKLTRLPFVANPIAPAEWNSNRSNGNCLLYSLHESLLANAKIPAAEKEALDGKIADLRGQVFETIGGEYLDKLAGRANPNIVNQELLVAASEEIDKVMANAALSADDRQQYLASYEFASAVIGEYNARVIRGGHGNATIAVPGGDSADETEMRRDIGGFMIAIGNVVLFSHDKERVSGYGVGDAARVINKHVLAINTVPVSGKSGSPTKDVISSYQLYRPDGVVVPYRAKDDGSIDMDGAAEKIPEDVLIILGVSGHFIGEPTISKGEYSVYNRNDEKIGANQLDVLIPVVVRASSSDGDVAAKPASKYVPKSELIGGNKPAFRNQFFENVQVLRENACIASGVIDDRVDTVLGSDSGGRRIWTNGAYANHHRATRLGLRYSADTFLATAGIDYKFPSMVSGLDQGVVGMSMTYADTSMKYRGSESLNGDKSKHGSFFFGPYIGYSANKFALSGSLLFARTKYKDTLSMHGGANLSDVALQKVKTQSYRGNSFHGKLSASYSIPCKQMIFKPIVSLNYDDIAHKQHKYGVVSLAKQRAKYLQAIFGIKLAASSDVGSRNVKPHLFVGFAHDLRCRDNVRDVLSLSDGTAANGTVFRPKRSSVLVGAGLSVSIADSVDFDLSYRGTFAKSSNANAVVAGLSCSF